MAAVMSYTWQFGDGQMAMGADVTHVYQAQLWGQASLLVVDALQDTAASRDLRRRRRSLLRQPGSMLRGHDLQ